jgi:hypothetical protein
MVTDVNRMEYLLNNVVIVAILMKKIVKEGNIMKTLRWLCNSYSMVKVLKRIDKKNGINNKNLRPKITTYI